MVRPRERPSPYFQHFCLRARARYAYERAIGTVSAVEKILDRLEGVRASGSGRWMARCAGHPDRTPSLSIREMPDGRVLLNCFSGCEVGDVLAAIGLQLSDLFDRPLAHHLAPIRHGFSARELIELTSHEAQVAALLAADAQKRPLTADEAVRLAQAADRLCTARALAHGR